MCKQTIENPFTSIREVAVAYQTAIKNEGSWKEEMDRCAEEIIDCLARCHFGYGQYLEESKKYESNESSVQNTEEGHNEHFFRWIFSSAYHARAIYGELWTIRQIAKEGVPVGNPSRQAGAPMPGLNKFDPVRVNRVRNKIIVHLKEEKFDEWKKATYKAFEGPIFYPDLDLDGKGTFDLGLRANVDEFLTELKSLMSLQIEK